MRISDWSSDVCSSDLDRVGHGSTSGFAVEFAEQFGTHFRDALTAVLHQEGEQPAHPLIIGAVVDEPAFPLGFHQTRPFENAQVMRPGGRSDERRVGKEGVSTFNSRWAPDDQKKNKNT